MKPLLKIETVPIQIECKMVSAKVQRRSRAQQCPAQRVAKAPGRVAGQQRQAKPNMDNVSLSRQRMPRLERRADAAKATVRFYDNQGKGQTAEYRARASAIEGGLVTVQLQREPMQNATEAARQRAAESTLPQTLEVTYRMEKLQYDMRQCDAGFEFTPASVEFSVTEYPKVVIEYLGSPIYVPPSAAPDYEPIDEFA